MSRPLSTSLVSNPTVRLADKLNSTFVGKYVGSRDVTLGGLPNKLYEFAVVRGDAPITRKVGEDYVEVQVSIGDIVSIFGGKAINQGMSEAKEGEIISFKFTGQKKGKGGRRFNNFEMAVIDAEN